MKGIILLFSIVLSAINICNGQGVATLQISSDTDAVVEITGTIDGAFQANYTLDKFKVSPKQTTIYKADVGNYGCFEVRINGLRCFVWVFSGDSLIINSVNNRIFFKGSNAAGHKYFNGQWNGTMWFVGSLQSMAKIAEDYSGIEAKMIEKFVDPANEYIDELVAADSVSTKYAEVIKRDIIDYQYGELWNILGQVSLNKRLTDSQKDQINEVTSSINERFSDYDDVLSLRFFLGSTYLDLKYKYKFEQLSNLQKEELLGNHTAKTFGPYTKWLLAPLEVQIAQFFSDIIVDDKYGFNSMDHASLINYMQEIAPRSESVAILTRIKQIQTPEAKGSIEYVKSEINSLADISRIPEIKGNYCFVDIWATWCMPCRQQFQYVEELHKLAAGYDNLKLVYITIDEESAEKEWKELIEKFNLTGFHIFANQKLSQDIALKIFQKNAISIPRYLLLSPAGEIIDPDMPRLEALIKIKEMLDKYLLR